MQLSQNDLRAVERELCKRSLAEFAKRAWHVLEPGTPLKWGWALDAICLHLEAVTDGRIKRLLMNVPPGSMKSLLTGVIWPAWEWGPRDMQEMRFVGTAHSQDLAIRDNMKCRRLIQSEWYSSLWDVVLMGDQNAKTKFENKRTGFRQATSFEGITGYRGDRVVLDDPHSVSNANSAVQLASDVTLFREALPSRVNNDNSAIVIVMQRLNEADVSAEAIKLGYVHLCIPMRFETERKCKTAIGWEDPRTEPGELMFPERFGDAQVRELEATLGTYGVAGQLQQRPAPRGGGLLKGAWFKYYEKPPALDFRVITADTAQKTGQENDYSVFQCWGRSRTGQAILMDQLRGKWEAPELLEKGRAFWVKHRDHPGAKLRGMFVEDKVSGTGLIQTLRREGIPVVPIQRSKDKVSRAYDAAPFIESGNVLLPQDRPMSDDLLAEAVVFPGGAHDDQLDPMFDAINIVQRVPVMNDAPVVAIPTTNHLARR